MQASQFRFSTARLFYFLTLCAAGTSLFGWLGVPIGCFVMLIWMQILTGVQRERAQLVEQTAPRTVTRRVGFSKLESIVVLMIVALVVGLMIPAGLDFDPQQQAATSMTMVAKAVDAYEQHFGASLPVVIVGENGQPLHSWRALILPFLGEDKLADAYRWDEPWNGPNNSLLAQYRPWHYRIDHPDLQSQRITTALHLLRDAEDRACVVESEQQVGDWLQPTHLPDWEFFDGVAAEDQGFWRHGFFSSDYRGRLAVSSQQTLRIHPSAGVAAERPLDQLIVAPILASAKPDQDWTDVRQPHRRLHLDNALRLAFFLVVALYPLRWLTRK